MKKILLSFLLVAFAFVSNAQLASKITTFKQLEQGQFREFNKDYADTLGSNDTIAFVFPITHTNDVNFVIDQRSKLVANDTTITIKFFESFDGVNYYAVTAGSSPSAYTKTLAKGGANALYTSASDICWFGTRYLKIMYISATKSGFKKIPYGVIKFNIGDK